MSNTSNHDNDGKNVESLPSMEWARKNPLAVRETFKGLSIYHCGIVLILVVVFVSFGIGFLARLRLLSNTVFSWWWFVVVCLSIISSLMLLVGSYLCRALPVESGAKGTISISIVCLAVSTLLSLAGGFFDPRYVGITNITLVIGTIAFMVSLKYLAVFIGREDLAQRIVSILNACAVVCLSWLCAFAILPSVN